MKCAILISLYNAEETLDETFKSLKRQTFQDFRIIAINDHSTDQTLSLIRKWQEKMGKDRFIIIDNDENIGLTRSLNKGLSQITEPYTARVDADDTWDTTKLEKQIAYLEKYPKCGIIGTWYINVSSRGDQKVMLPVIDADIKKSIFKRNPFAHSCVIFRTELIKEAGCYDESIRFGQDYELWLRLLPKTNFANIPEFLCSRKIENTLTSGGSQQRKQMLQCIKTQIKYIKKYQQSPGYYRYTIEPLILILLPDWIKKAKRLIFNR